MTDPGVVTENMGTGDASVADSFGAETNQSSEGQDISITEQDVPFMSDADIEAMLENGSENHKDSDEGESEENPSQEDNDSQEDDDTKKEATDSAAQEDGESEEGGTSDDDESEVKTLRQELERKNRQVVDQQKFIQRRNQEYGDLKKQLNAELADLKTKMDDMTPAELAEYGPKLHELKQKIEGVKQHEEMFNHVIDTQEGVFAVIPEEDFDVDGMADELKRCGGDANYIERFKQNPFMAARKHEIIMLHHAAKNGKMARILATALKKEREEKKVLAGKPKELLKKINKVAVNSNGVTGKNAGGTSRKERLATLSDKEIANLSDKELENLLAESKRLGR